MPPKINFDATRTTKRLSRVRDRSEQAMDRTMGEIRTRGPGWIAKGVRQEYNISKERINKDLRITGSSLDDVTFVYRGSPLTPAGFNMSPKVPKPGSYTIKATIRKGQRVAIGRVKKISKKQRRALGRNFQRRGPLTSLSSPPMLITTGNTRAGGTDYIPMQRVRPGHSPMSKAIRTLSVPQMIQDGKGQTKRAVQENLRENIEKRFTHNTKSIISQL